MVCIFSTKKNKTKSSIFSKKTVLLESNSRSQKLVYIFFEIVRKVYDKHFSIHLIISFVSFLNGKMSLYTAEKVTFLVITNLYKV